MEAKAIILSELYINQSIVKQSKANILKSLIAAKFLIGLHITPYDTKAIAKHMIAGHKLYILYEKSQYIDKKKMMLSPQGLLNLKLSTACIKQLNKCIKNYYLLLQ
jgi:hypothetical protein